MGKFLGRGDNPQRLQSISQPRNHAARRLDRLKLGQGFSGDHLPRQHQGNTGGVGAETIGTDLAHRLRYRHPSLGGKECLPRREGGTGDGL